MVNLFKLSVVAVSLSVALGFGLNMSRTWEQMLPMRDGILLHTRFIMPKQDTEGGLLFSLYDSFLMDVY